MRTIDEHTVPGHLDIVEDYEGVLLVEAARQRMLETIGVHRHAVATDELQTGVSIGMQKLNACSGAASGMGPLG